MSSRKKGLGRGLGEMGVTELLGGFEAPGAISSVLAADANNTLKEVDVSLLSPGKYQPRRHMDPTSLDELTSSIRAEGILQPILVRSQGTGYEIIAGERRFQAAKRAGLTEVPVVVRELSDQSALAVGLIENIQRQDLNAIEEAVAFNRLIEEFNMTHQQVAQAVGRSRAAVTNMLRLLKLTPAVRELVEKRKIDMGHARALLSLGETQQLLAAKQIVDKGLSVRQTEQLIQSYLHTEQYSSKTTKEQDPNVLHLERTLADKLGATVKIQQKDKEKGRLVINYNSLEELDGILEHIK